MSTSRQTAESIELDKRIARMYLEEDMSTREIAAVFGVSYKRIWQRLVRTGTPIRSGRVKQKILKMIDDMTIAGASLDAIALVLQQQHGMSRHTAEKHSRVRRREIREQRIQRAIDLYEANRSTYKVAEIIGVSDMTILNWLRARGVDTSDVRGYDDATKAKALRLLAKKGATNKSVAEEIGCSDGAISLWRRAANGIGRSRVRSPNELKWHLNRRRKAIAKARKDAERRDRAAIAAATRVK